MNEDRFAGTLRDWLSASAPAAAPDRILDAVAARIDDLDQVGRPRWWSVRVAAAGSLVGVIAGALLFASISRVGSPAPSPTLPAAPTSILCEASPCSFALIEGTGYASAAFDPGVTLEAPSDRWQVVEDQPGLFRLVVGRDERRNITVLLDPIPTDPSGRHVAADVEGSEAFGAWLAERDELLVSPPDQVVVAGLEGRVVDVRGAAGRTTTSGGCMSEGPCAAVFGYATGSGPERVYGAASVDAIRLYLLDAAEHLVVIAVEARHSAPVSFLDGEAQEMLESLEIGSLP